jgi:AcrR family transcriptional regulator
MQDTKTRILDAAEQLLSERGFTAISLRAVTAGAGVNLGAVNYHFQSKKALIQAVFARRLAPLNRRRIEALDACDARAAGRPVSLEELLHAFLGPVMRPDGAGAGFVQLMGRMYTEPSLDVRRIFSAEMGEIAQRFIRELRRALPELPPEELFWRLFFTIGAMAQTLGVGSLLRLISGGVCDPSDLEGIEKRLIRFAGAGFRASAGGAKGKKKAARVRVSRRVPANPMRTAPPGRPLSHDGTHHDQSD